jgi:hypothetical protein
MATKILTQDRLKELLHYDPATGVFTWRISPRPNVPVGAIAGATDPKRKHVIIGIGGRLYRAHRLAWLYVHGEWPVSEIDHINRNGGDNRFSNLRLADRFINTQNTGLRKDNKSGYRGVNWSKATGKWRARIQANKRKIDLGCFSEISDAVAAYEKAANERHCGRLVNATPHL